MSRVTRPHRASARARALLAAIITVGASVVGCNADALSGSELGGTCLSDADCASDTVCALGVCAMASDLGLVHVEVRPPMASGLLTQQFFDVEPQADTRTGITLSATAGLSGSVSRFDGGAASARLTAQPEDAIAGRVLVQSTESTSTGGYALSLVDGARHTLTVYADEDVLPPLILDDPAVANTGGAATRDVVLPDPATLLVVSGRVIAGEGAGAIGIPALDVRVVDERGRRVSSIALTDELGAFAVRLADHRTGALTLVVRPSDQQAFFPERTVDLGEISADLALEEPITLGVIGSPVPVRGRVRGPDGAVVAGAAIYLRGAVGTGTIRRQLTSGEDGAFDADLVPGRYDVAVVAPTTDALAGMLLLADGTALDIPAEEDIELSLPPRPMLDAVFTHPDGTPLVAAQVRLDRLSGVGGVVEAVIADAALTVTTTTDAEGRIGVRVDPGRHRVHVAPTPSPDAPLSTFVIDVYAEPEPLSFTLPPAQLAAGTATGPGGGALADAQVRVFSRLVDESGQAIFLGEGTTDADGNFAVPVPDLLQSVAGEDG